MQFMPQVTLQYTSNIKPPNGFYQLFSDVHKTIHDIAGIKIDNCKSRSIPLDNYYIGDGSDNKGFLHLEVKIMEGRTSMVKSELGKSLLQILTNQFTESIKLLELQITVEIIDIQKNFYYKYPEGTLSH
jgi:5-carboxymethyl-2-hydroxymuconate isomerase